MPTLACGVTPHTTQRPYAAALQAQSSMQSANAQSEAVRADNLALLERLKYVQGYQAQGRPRKGADTVCIHCLPCKDISDSARLGRASHLRGLLSIGYDVACVQVHKSQCCDA